MDKPIGRWGTVKIAQIEKLILCAKQQICQHPVENEYIQYNLLNKEYGLLQMRYTFCKFELASSDGSQAFYHRWNELEIPKFASWYEIW